MKDQRTKQKEINEKLALPNDFIWKLFGCLLRDLGCSKDKTADQDNYTTDRSETEYAKAYYSAYRSRSLEKLYECFGKFDTQRNLELVNTAEEFFVLHQLAGFLKKYPFHGETARQAAVVKFLEMEHNCSVFNKENYRAILVLNEKHPAFFGILDEVREDIRKMLGPTPPLEKIYGLAAHGPGATVDAKQHSGGSTTSLFKWRELPYTVTAGCRPHAQQAILSDPRWLGALDDWYRRTHLNSNFTCAIEPEKFWTAVLRIVDDSRHATVPKTALTDRSICIEPVLNVFLQLGVDGYIRGRLKRFWGIDLNTQEVNQLLALEGSLTNELATLDLRGASDTVALMCCWLLLPVQWMDLLLDLRCKNTEVNVGTPSIPIPVTIGLEKISSMGNGYTFVLESVIFAALTRVAIRRTRAPQTYSVYGDDIILPSSAAGFLTELLELFGFSLNRDKSFVTGPFRESCGTDYYKGTNVRPVFVTDEILRVTNLLHVYNAMWSLERNLPWHFGITFRNTKQFLLRYLPKWLDSSFYGPPSETTDSYVFYESRAYSYRSETVKNVGQWVHNCIKPIPLTYRRRYKDFFFLKLMCALKPRGHNRIQKWMKRKEMNTGNAFDITKRDHVRYIRTERVLY